MKFLLDSCISFFAVKDLREKKFDVTWIPETGKDPGDEEIIKKAYRENLVLVTVDKDFGELVFLKKMESPTIIRLVNIQAKVQGEVLLRLIQSYKKEIESGTIMTVDKYRVRIRHLYE
jgi:predicted nuclease of predicted toxin-antitoxin system